MEISPQRWYPGYVGEDSLLGRDSKILEESQAGEVAQSRKTPSVLLSSVANSFQDNPARVASKFGHWENLFAPLLGKSKGNKTVDVLCPFLYVKDLKSSGENSWLRKGNIQEHSWLGAGTSIQKIWEEFRAAEGDCLGNSRLRIFIQNWFKRILWGFRAGEREYPGKRQAS